MSRLFWGRGNFYKNAAQFVVIGITAVIVVSGIFSRLESVNADEESINLSYGISGMDDLLQQGGSLETVLVMDHRFKGVKTQKHIVQPGETLESISKDYNVSIDTIRWASVDVIGYFSNKIHTGWELTIPEINGVLYEVKKGDNLKKVIRITKGNEYDVIEFNNLEPPYDLENGQTLFIPDGNLINPTRNVKVAGIPRGVFINPLKFPECNGYGVSRGFLPWHNGVDLAHAPCPVIAVANGVIEYAGWSSHGQGYNVIIDHGGGIKTHYYHGTGQFFVKKGQRVQQGQKIMMMGTTGNSTGNHLHFSLFKNGTAIDPKGYVPY